MSKKVTLTFKEQKEAEQNSVTSFIDFFKEEKDFSKVIYTDWTAKDVLGHITSWHMSFAKNLTDSVKNIKPTPFKGSLTEVNEREVKLMSQFTVLGLINKIEKAQEQIDLHIGNENITTIAYKKGSRDYSPIEHLEIVSRHINSHLKDLSAKFK